tara:strand:+ start:7179 stop:8183 length:1005 start_codon:yes stop_codon:yes gene_type:complete
MKYLITGSAGFIGSSLAIQLLKSGQTVIGVDNHNDYYDPKLKDDRVSRLITFENYSHNKISIEDPGLESIFEDFKPDYVVNLAAQAGVRYSLENPMSYIQSNLVGFGQILEFSRHHDVKHLVYASSSSVYGGNKKIPFSERDQVNHPLSLYAATKRANELMAHTYSHLYNIPTTGLRFFTVYGPWGRPDMALFKFTDSIIKGDPIEVYNYGDHSRDFTYIDDIVEGIIASTHTIPEPDLEWDGENPNPSSSLAPWRIFNIGNSRPEQLMNYIQTLEDKLGMKAKTKMLPMQPGDVKDTYADTSLLEAATDYKSKTNINIGIGNFVEWYLDYYDI